LPVACVCLQVDSLGACIVSQWCCISKLREAPSHFIFFHLFYSLFVAISSIVHHASAP
jgi:hypothetical protein